MADYTRNSATLPALYQDDAVSFAQVDAYLGLADDLNEAVVELIEDLTFGLGPDAALRWPTDLPLSAGPDALVASLTERYDALAAWFAFDVPTSWGSGEQGLAARREFVARAARIWRRRGTPQGFLDWFTLYFAYRPATADDDGDEVPFLLEHFKVPGGNFSPDPYTATLFVPNLPQFSDYRRRIEAAQFTRWYAPAHVSLRLCFIAPGRLATQATFSTPLTLAPDADEDAVTEYSKTLRDHAKELRQLACDIVSLVDHANGIHIYGCDDDGIPVNDTERSVDHIDIGKLPTTGTAD